MRRPQRIFNLAKEQSAVMATAEQILNSDPPGEAGDEMQGSKKPVTRIFRRK